MSVENIRANLLMANKQIWELPHYYNVYKADDSSDDESSSEESDEEEEASKKKVKVRDGHALEFFIEEEQKHLAK